MTKNEIITVAKCCIVDNCGPCPLMGTDNCITGFMNHILEYMKNEPAQICSLSTKECRNVSREPLTSVKYMERYLAREVS